MYALFRPVMQTFTLAHPARFFLCPARNKMPGLAQCTSLVQNTAVPLDGQPMRGKVCAWLKD